MSFKPVDHESASSNKRTQQRKPVEDIPHDKDIARDKVLADNKLRRPRGDKFHDAPGGKRIDLGSRDPA